MVLSDPGAGLATVTAGGPNGSGSATTIGVEQALDAAATELWDAAEGLRRAGHAEDAEIVSVGAAIAEDPVLRAEASARVDAGSSPAEAIVAVCEAHAAAVESLGDPTLRERAADVRQVGRRAAAWALGRSALPTERPGPLVMVAEELGPADLLGRDGVQVVAGVAVRGGPSSHAAIVARSIGIPLVLGVDRSVLGADLASVIVDGDDGLVIVRPDDDELSRARAAMRGAADRRTAMASERGLPSKTTDGRRVTLLCNVATESETLAGLEAGAEGVGLLRTELPFLEATAWPDEAAHRRSLEPILRLLAGRPAIVRVLDFGGDKVPPFLASALPEVSGPHLRGLPALLSAEGALGAQLRAAIDAGRRCRLGILIPMVTSMREARLARDAVATAAAAVGAPVPEVGVMVEVPSAALIVDRLAGEMDFLSVGTNDLTEHALGVNRRDPAARPALAAHPSVLTLINRVVRAGRVRGRSVEICGEAAADPLVMPLLIGLGATSLSVSPARIDDVRSRIRRLSFASCAAAARDAMAADSIEEVWDLARSVC
jgi:phosphoenolpyruvate-protein kinase (PTS system EI component)